MYNIRKLFHRVSQSSGFVNCDIYNVRLFSRKDLFITFRGVSRKVNADVDGRTRIKDAIRIFEKDYEYLLVSRLNMTVAYLRQ